MDDEYLVAYIRALELGQDSAMGASDRAAYEGHLARAARLARAIMDQEHAAIGPLIDDAERAHGRGFLEGELGGRADAAFAKLARRLRGTADQGERSD